MWQPDGPGKQEGLRYRSVQKSLIFRLYIYSVSLTIDVTVEPGDPDNPGTGE